MDPTWTFASPNPVEVVVAGPQATRLQSIIDQKKHLWDSRNYWDNFGEAVDNAKKATCYHNLL